jgi:UDP-glucose 4-epimerase
MRVLVTGGAGFIGSATLEALEAAEHIGTAFDREHGHDVRVLSDVFRAVKGNDAVIHLAGVLGTHELFDCPERAIDVNITGTLNVLKACASLGARYVGITMPDVFPSIYTATKVAAQRLASVFHHNYDVPTCHVRAFNAFGKGQKFGPSHPQKIIPTFASRSWMEQPLPIWGDGEQTVDLIHVSHLARMLVDALDSTDDGVIDGGTGKALSVLQVAEMVNRMTGSKAGVVHLPMRRGEKPTNIVAKGEGWHRLHGWRPQLSQDHVRETVAWYMP